MQITLGWTYAFKFTKDFTSIDGIYKVVKIYSYEEFVNDQLNLVDLYTKVGKTEQDLELDVEDYKQQNIYKLVNPEKYDDIIYIPEGIISDIPNFNIKQYSKLVVAFDIGVYPGTENITSVRDIMSEHLTTQLGYANTPDIITIKHVWLTDQQYNDIQQTRDQNKKDIINYFSENQKLLKQQQELKAIIDNYDKLFKDWISKKTTQVNSRSGLRYIVVEKDADRFALTSEIVQLGDMIEVKETRTIYKIISLENLNNGAGYLIHDLSNPTFVTVLTESDKFALTTSKVQLNDRVKVEETKTLYKVIDIDNLDNKSGYSVELIEKKESNIPRCIEVQNDTQRFLLTPQKVNLGDYVLVDSTKNLFKVISVYYLDNEKGYQQISIK